MTAAYTYDSWSSAYDYWATQQTTGDTIPAYSFDSSSSFPSDFLGDAITTTMTTSSATTNTTPATSNVSASSSSQVPYDAAGPASSGAQDAQIAQTTLNYQPLFRSSLEIPRFHTPYRWWEDEARTVLWSFDTRQVMLVIRFGLFNDGNQPRAALQKRDATFIEKLIEGLLQPYELPYLPGLSHAQRVEEILRRCQVTEPVNVSWSWFPARARLVTDPATVAQEIEAESHLQFRSVPFETWVRYSLGYAAPEVDWFLLQHTVFYIVLFNYLQTYPQEIPKYQQVGKLMSTKSPFAHRAIVECLSRFQPNSAGAASRTYAPGFEFIAGPIQALFNASRLGLYNTVKLLSVVSIRFQQTYIHVPHMDWHKKLDTQVPLLNSLLASHSATDFARSLTRSDDSKLSQLSREKLIDDKNPTVEALHERWSTLSTNVYECCTALPETVPYIQQSAEILHSLRNYYSTIALIHGLQLVALSYSWTSLTTDGEESISMVSLTPASLLYLSDASNNHAAYRQAMKTTPGIPFLVPHIEEYRLHGEVALDELFTRS
ncbi:Piezo-type mechanosensitive ion channel component 1 [Talaromyces islandicus]|uniref:Piezo-type mechanosensitive ion channel component 1 n=1 Tax=Talaromyces islandicus TaxID=28573 RepID=A0A0U1LIP6_TALIS|nr:Piezo-type mechanosensitive ion channel component 1 [Talaromyces islandicus]